MRKEARTQRPDTWHIQNWHLHPHMALLAKINIIVPQPNLAPWDLFLFPKMKKQKKE
jgi:hypothetical protein